MEVREAMNPMQAIRNAITTGDLAHLRELKAGGIPLLLDDDPSSPTALHLAAASGAREIVAFLLSQGADPLAIRENETPAQTALRHGHAIVAEVIEAHAATSAPACPLITSFCWGEIEDSEGRIFKDARLFPGGAEAWDWRRTGTRHEPGIQIADVEDLLSLRPQSVILSRGVDLVLQVPQATVDFVAKHVPEVLVLQSEAAVKEYNRRAASELVVALIHSTC